MPGATWHKQRTVISSLGEKNTHRGGIHTILDFSDGPVVGDMTANAGDMGWISGLGRFHMPQGS